MKTLPEDFNPDSFDEIPYGNERLFEEKDPELETMAREAIRASLQTRLGKPVVGREALHHRFGLRNLGFNKEDLMMGRVLIR